MRSCRARYCREIRLHDKIKSKCLPVLMNGLDACPTNSADRQSLQFTVNKIIYKIFGPMAKDS